MRIALYVPNLASLKGVNAEAFWHGSFLKKLYPDAELVWVTSVAPDEEQKQKLLSEKIIYVSSDNLEGLIETFKRLKIDIFHIRGILSPFLSQLCRAVLKTPAKLVISPYSHITYYNFSHKLFREDPDVKSLTGGAIRKSYSNFFSVIKQVKARLEDCFVPLAKKFYFVLETRDVLEKADGLVFLSSFERQIFFDIAKKVRINFSGKELIIPEALWDDSRVKQVLSEGRKAEKNKPFINIIFWGRLDYYVKGLDRLLNWVKRSENVIRENNIKFYLMGPSYQSGGRKTFKMINKYHLMDVVEISDESVWRGTMRPLYEADYSILLSKWDGFPRALRESIALGVPIIVSQETNFADLIENFRCGFVVNSAKEFNDLMVSLPAQNQQVLAENSIKASYDIRPESIINRLWQFYSLLTD